MVTDIEAAEMDEARLECDDSRDLGHSRAVDPGLPAEMRTSYCARAGALDAAVGLGTAVVPIFGLTEDDVTRPETVVGRSSTGYSRDSSSRTRRARFFRTGRKAVEAKSTRSTAT
jgi:hypothetical protein